MNKKRPAKQRIASKGSEEGPATSETQTTPSQVQRSTKHAADEPRGQDRDASKKSTNKPRVARKPRAKSKAGAESGNLKLGGRVTKASKMEETQSKTTKKKVTRKTSAVQPVLKDCPEGTSTPAPSNALGADEALNLDEALRRRRDWTPPTETALHPVSSVNDEQNTAQVPNTSIKSDFGSILTDYNYCESVSDSRELSASSEGGPTKRRKIELVDPQVSGRTLPKRTPGDETLDKSDTSSNISSRRQPARKPKPPKRFTTLTARMTAQYRTEDVDDEPRGDDITQFVIQTDPHHDQNKKASGATPGIVLPPEAAFETLDQQDVIFGTCSQLERDDSPETLREMQEAFRISEDLAFQGRSEATCLSITGQALPSENPSGSVSRSNSTRKLWSVAGRDTEGSLVQGGAVESVDLTGTSAGSNHADGPNAVLAATNLNGGASDDGWLDLDYGKSGFSLTTKVTEKHASKKAIGADAVITDTCLPPLRKTPTVLQEIDQPSSVSQHAPMPQYNGFTETELSKQVAAYGFKSVKGRKKMIELLEKCWVSKHGKADVSSSLASEVNSAGNSETVSAQKTAASFEKTSKSKAKKNATQKPPVSAKSTRIAKAATPKKHKQAPATANAAQRPPPSSYIDIEEIQDSEDEPSLSPIRIEKQQSIISPTTIVSIENPSLEPQVLGHDQVRNASMKAKSKSSHIPKMTESITARKTNQRFAENDLKDLSIQITAAVRAQSRLHNANSRARPTWHEKILMYDPIILEDFTAWLNVEGLSLVDEDREVSTALVREWCERKGICCGWKKNASG